MADDRVLVGGTAEYLQTFSNLIAGRKVHSEAVTLCDRYGRPLRSDDEDQTLVVRELSRSRGNPSVAPFTISAAASPFTLTVVTAGNALRVFWITAAADPAGGVYPRISVVLPTDTEPAREIYRARAISHSEMFEGAADASLTISIDQNATVDGTVHYEEFTP